MSSATASDAAGTPAALPGASRGAARFPCFDGLRAIAALAVVVYHVVTTYDLTTLTLSWGWIDRLGNFGVAVFFLISGFLLYRPFVLSHFESRPAPGLGGFWKRRFFRIFPGYWVALTFMVYVLGLMTIQTVEGFLTAYGLLQNYRAGYPLYGLGVEWTLVIEVSFYLVLPFIAMALRSFTRSRASLRAKLRAQLIGLLGLYAIAMGARFWRLWILDAPTPKRGDWLPLTQIDHWIVGYLDWFALGMLLAVGSAWLAVGGRLPWIARALGRHPVVCWLLSIELFWVGQQLHLPTNVLGTLTRTQSFGVALIFGLVAFLLIFPAVFGPQDQSVLRRFLQARVMVALGTISYGIYLWHIIWVREVKAWTLSGDLPKNLWLWFAVVLGLTLLSATLSYHLVEKPLIRLSQRRFRSR